jgi:uncharacterized protein (DUF1697 family)
MPLYISILRGINVSGQKMIKMEELRKSYEKLGFKNVRSYIQSGNVLFESAKASLSSLEKKISAAIMKDFGFDVPVIVLEKTELLSILKNNPFKKEDVAHLYVTILSEAPDKSDIEKISGLVSGKDEFKVKDRHIYLYVPGGYGNTKLSNTFFEKKLQRSATTRNWKTLNELIALASGEIK